MCESDSLSCPPSKNTLECKSEGPFESYEKKGNLILELKIPLNFVFLAVIIQQVVRTRGI